MRDPSRPVFCLLAEDDPLVGLDLADALEAEGCYVAGPFRSGREAVRWLDRFTPDIAVVDLALADGLCRDLVATLLGRGIPFLIHSGTRACRNPLPALSREPWFEKPACPRAIATALHDLLATARKIGSVTRLSPGEEVEDATPLAALQQQ